MSCIIALTGPKGSGKDTVARMLVQHGTKHGKRVKTVAFADPIKKEVQRIFDLNPDNNDQYDLFKRIDITYRLHGHLEHTVSGRQIVREIGMLMRSYNDKQFNDYVMNQVRSDPYAWWVVTDLRFQNEYDMISSFRNAFFVKIKRPMIVYDGHVTETEFPDHMISHIINNDSTLEVLENKVQKFVEEQLL